MTDPRISPVYPVPSEMRHERPDYKVGWLNCRCYQCGLEFRTSEDRRHCFVCEPRKDERIEAEARRLCEEDGNDPDDVLALNSQGFYKYPGWLHYRDEAARNLGLDIPSEKEDSVQCQ